MTLKEALRRIEALEVEVAKLKAKPAQEFHYHHYYQPQPQPDPYRWVYQPVTTPQWTWTVGTTGEVMAFNG